MIKCRPVRGALADSMEEVVEIQDRPQLLAWLNSLLCVTATEDNVKLEYYGPDPRIGWNCWLIKVMDIPMGYANGGEDFREAVYV